MVLEGLDFWEPKFIRNRFVNEKLYGLETIIRVNSINTKRMHLREENGL